MKILYLKTIDPNLKHVNDFLHDTLLIGLRNLYGGNVIDYPGAWYMYKDEQEKKLVDKNTIWGKGFTLYDSLDQYGKIDRSDIKNKIKNNFFNYIIYGSIRGENIFFQEAVDSKSKIAFIDTSDDGFIDDKKINKGLYFKRELYLKKTNVLPISYAVPKKKIVKEVALKPEKILSPLIPGKKKTYIYKNEVEYFNMYKNSLFSLTYRKTGWDCLRHYEILASGSLPLFLDINSCPKTVCCTLPKNEIQNILKKFSWTLNFYNPFSILKKRYRNKEIFINFLLNSLRKKITVEEFFHKYPEIIDIRHNLLSYTRANLTSEKLAEYIVNKLLKA